MGNNRKSAPMAQVSFKINELVSKEGLLFRDAFENKVLSKRITEHFTHYRERVFGPTTTLFAFLSQMLSADKSCAEAVARVNVERIAKKQVPVSADNSGYCKARNRMTEEFLHGLVTDTAQAIEAKAPEEWLWKNRTVKLIDGSMLTMADTPENQLQYPQHSNQKNGVGFPITRILTVFSLATGCILDAANGQNQGKGTGEHGLLRKLMHCFNPGDIVIGDGIFSVYFLMALFQAHGVDVLFSADVRRSVNFKKGRRLGKWDHIVLWEKTVKPDWMEQQQYEVMPATLQVRECRVTLDQPGFRSKTVTLVTSLLSRQQVSNQELGWLYWQRWAAELNLGAIKTTLKMEHLRSKTPEMVRKEIWATFLAYNLVRKLMGEAAYQYGLLPKEVSFKGAVQNFNAFRPLWSFSSSKPDEVFLQILLLLISQGRVGNRPGRIEPRAIKKRPRAFPRLHLPRKAAREEIIKNAML